MMKLLTRLGHRIMFILRSPNTFLEQTGMMLRGGFLNRRLVLPFVPGTYRRARYLPKGPIVNRECENDSMSNF